MDDIVTKEENQRSSRNERKMVIKTYLSQEEYDYVRKNAGAMKLSAFLRMSLLFSGRGKIQLHIQTDDLWALSRELSVYNQRMAGIIAALSYRQDLYATDIANFEKMQKELNDTVKKMYNMAVTDRKYNRRKADQYLREEMDNIFATAVSELKLAGKVASVKGGKGNEKISSENQ